MDKKDCFYLGKITKPFGYKGELVFWFDVDEPLNYKDLQSVLIELKTGLVPFIIESLQFKNNTDAIVRLEDLLPDAALTLVGKDLYLPLKLLPKLSGNKFYFHEVIGFDVVDVKHGNIGKIDAILDYPAQEIMQIVNEDKKEILIPVIDQIILNVDRKNSKMEIDAPEGLIELYL